MGIDKWHEEMHKILKKGEFETEKIPAVVQRCPMCKSLSLQFDVKKGRIYCRKCSFEEYFPVLK